MCWRRRRAGGRVAAPNPSHYLFALSASCGPDKPWRGTCPSKSSWWPAAAPCHGHRLRTRRLGQALSSSPGPNRDRLRPAQREPGSKCANNQNNANPKEDEPYRDPDSTWSRLDVITRWSLEDSQEPLRRILAGLDLRAPRLSRSAGA